MPAERAPHTRRSLANDMSALGITPGDVLMAHAALSRIGRVLGGPDAVIGALRDALGPEGTLMVYTDWNGDFDDLRDADGDVPEAIRPDITPFDPLTSRAIRDNGTLPEFVRTTPGALRSGNPGASCAAIGTRAQWLVADHALQYGYGEQSPLGKLVEADGKVLLLGSPLDTLTLLHHAEHLAGIAGKRILRKRDPLLEDGRVVWRWIEEFDTGDPIVEGLAEDYFATIVSEFLATGKGKRGTIGAAPSVLVQAREIVPFAVDWLESRFPR
ncbi:aminoglycoside 3-N-acetyltransferase [Paradevosia shaoguanensis]|uniref:aminoglycoside 3-N-acetyltransferase n=1 Tax=Paradevosia shaoguanensis TaxID=1335043 RepID=UPI003C7103F1